MDVYRDTPFRAYHFTHNQDDSLHFAYQMPHRWNVGNVKVHVHFIPCVNPAVTEYVVWESTWSWADFATEVPVLTGWTVTEARSTISTTAAFKPAVTGLFTATPTANARESSFLLVRVRRLGFSAPTTPGWADTYTTAKAYGTATANVMLLGSDGHYQSEKIGTVAEF